MEADGGSCRFLNWNKARQSSHTRRKSRAGTHLYRKEALRVEDDLGRAEADSAEVGVETVRELERPTRFLVDRTTKGESRQRDR